MFYKAHLADTKMHKLNTSLENAVTVNICHKLEILTICCVICTIHRFLCTVVYFRLITHICSGN